MSEIQQTQFLGLSVTSFNCTLGWGDSVSEVQIRLVQDTSNGDTVPDIQDIMGRPVSFTFGEFRFDGIVQFFGRDDSTEGSPLYNATITDPRKLLDFTKVILSDYTDPITVPNLINAYGYLEESAFGSSGINESGIKWNVLRGALVDVTNVLGGAYGGSIIFRGRNYRLDLTTLPVLSDDFRLGGNAMSMSDIIREVCEAGACDYFVELRIIDNTNFIRVVTASRAIQPTFGIISQYVANTPGAVSKDVGFEVRGENTSKFVAGGNVESLYYEFYNGPTVATPFSASDSNTRLEFDWHNIDIWPYWGLDENNNVIIAEQLGTNHQFRLDARNVPVLGIGATYFTNTAELRAAMEGQSSWESFLALTNGHEYVESVGGAKQAVYWEVVIRPTDGKPFMRRTGTITVYFEDGERKIIPANPEAVYRHDEMINPHFGKAFTLGMITQISPNIKSLLTNATPLQLPKIPFDLSKIDRDLINKFGMAPGSIEDNAQRLWQYIKQFGDEHYGRKFMIRVPTLETAIDEDTGTPRYNYEPGDGGYVDEAFHADAIELGLLPNSINRISLDDGRIVHFAKFSGATEALRIEKLNQDDFAIGQVTIEDGGRKYTVSSLFLKISLDPIVKYGNFADKTDARIVFELPQIVDVYVPAYGSVYTDEIRKALLFNTTGISSQDVDDYIRKLMNSIGGDQLFDGAAPLYYIPETVAIGLRSNIDFYGPWSSIGEAGGVDFEQDTSLVPWNYGNYDAMIAAGNAKVLEASSNQLMAEAGNIEIPGGPDYSLGAQLLGSGPYITNINCNISDAGVTTHYEMKTWTNNFSKQAKSTADRIANISRAIFRLNRETREKTKKSGKHKQFTKRANAILKPPRQVHRSSHKYISGECFFQNIYDPSGSIVIDDSGVMPNVVVQPEYNMITQVGHDYETKATVSADFMFRPFSAYSGHDFMAHFEVPVSGASEPTITNLNPFGSGHDFLLVTQSLPGSGFPQDMKNLRYEDPTSYRGMALRGPLIVSGWGYDTAGNPLPSGANGEFVDYYRQKSHLWPTGPVDLRWDQRRKVWVTGSTCPSRNDIQKITMIGTPTGGTFSIQTNINGSGETIVDIPYNITASGLGEYMEVQSVVISSGDMIMSGGPFPFTEIVAEFGGTVGNQSIPIMIANRAGLTGGLINGMIITRVEEGHT